MKRFACFLVSALLLLSLLACSQQANSVYSSPSEAAVGEIQPWLFSIQLERKTLILNEAGQIVLEGDGLRLAYDLLTQKPYCIIAERYVSGVHGVKSDVVESSAVYDLDGTMLQGWKPLVYRDAFAPFLLAGKEDYWGAQPAEEEEEPVKHETALLNFRTGAMEFEGVMGLGAASVSSAFLTDENGVVMGILDVLSGKATGFPMPEKYTAVAQWKDYFIAEELSGGRPVYRLLDKKLAVVLNRAYAKMLPTYPMQDYLLLAQKEGAMHQLFSVQDKKAVIELDTDEIPYFDGGFLMAMNSGSYSVQNANGTVVAEGYSWMQPVFAKGGQQADLFFAQKGASMYALGREGAVRASVEMPYYEAVDTLTESGKALLMVRYTGPIAKDEVETREGVALLDDALQEIVPSGKYSRFYCDSVLPASYIVAERLSQGAKQGTMDIMDGTGKLLLENIAEIHAQTPTRLIVKWNGTVGLIDLQGNWLYKVPQ